MRPATTTPTAAPERLGYLPALDGIRALAVTAVVLHHLTLTFRERGGYLGVSTFLTLSGFLITTLLLQEAGGGRVGLLAFWARRYRRLWPAAAVNVLLILGLTMAGRLPSVGMFGDVVSVFLNVTNWRFVMVGEEAPLRLVSPFIPQWSLAVEEQLYVVVPLVVVGALAAAGRARLRLVVGVAMGAAVAAATWRSVTADFYLLSEWYRTEIRMGELAAGGLLACLWRPGRVADSSPRVRRAAELVGWVGLGVTLWWWATVSPTAEWVRAGGFTLIALVSVLFLVGTLANGPLARLLSLPPLVWLGRRSYGIYLFHWPLYLALRTPWLEANPGPAFLIRTGTTLVLAECSYRLVEQPVRGGRVLPAPRFTGLVLLGSLALVAVASQVGT